MKIRAVAIVAGLFLIAFAATDARARQFEPKDARNQGHEFDRAATEIAKAIHDANLKKVVVFDFVGPGKNLTELGPIFTSEFRNALTSADRHIEVEDPTTLQRKMNESDYGPEHSLDDDSLLALAAYLHMDVAVFGTITQQNGEFQIALRAMRPGKNNAHPMTTENVVVAPTDLINKMSKTYIARASDRPDLNDPTYPVSGKNGYSFPRCTYCPPAEFSEAARTAKFQGTVTLVCVVTPEGRATDIHALNKLPGGLTQKAIEAVQRWEFQPATDSSGNPVAVRQVIEVTFHLY